MQEFGQETTQDTESLASYCVTINFVQGMYEATSRGPNLRFIEDTSDELSSFEVHNAFFRVWTPAILGDLRLANKYKRCTIWWRNIFQNRSDHLFSSPARNRFDDCGRDSLYPITYNMTAFRAQTVVNELLIGCAIEERISVTHPDGYRYVILNETSQWFSSCCGEILVIGVCNLQCFSTGDFVLREVHIHFISIEISIVCVAVRVVHANGFLAR
jgi:hypothetical protein